MCITITGLDWSVCDKLAGKYAEGVCLKFNKTGSAMASAGRRKRRVRVDESLITDFLDLRDSSIVQTGPKRPRGTGVVPLTPAEPTPLRQRTRDTSSDTKEQPLAETVRELIESAAEVSALTPGLPARAILTPTPARTPRRSSRLAALVETPGEDAPTLRSALKGIHSLSKSGREADSRVSFGEYVTVTEYSPEYHGAREGRSVTSGEGTEHLGAGDVVLEPLEEGEGSSEEGEGGEIEGGVSEEEEGGGGGEIEGRISEEEEEGGREIEGGSDQEEEDEPRLKTPRVASQKAGRSPRLTTPRYSNFRKSKPSPVRRTAPKGRPGKQPKVVKTLPRSLSKNLFTLFCKRRVTKDAMDLILKLYVNLHYVLSASQSLSSVTEVYLKRASEDLAVFARHAGRRTIEVEDVVLLLRRQRHISESQGFEYLVNTYLPLEYIEELLPCAVAGKRIVPSMKP